ncbi:MAG: IclR family transcriptional regulator, partial [Verrucomicrobiota bacterium]
MIGESVYVGILYDDQVLYIDHRDGTGPVRIAGQVGGRYPLHCTAPGKVLFSIKGAARKRT